jgi:hypothetical protein
VAPRSARIHDFRNIRPSLQPSNPRQNSFWNSAEPSGNPKCSKQLFPSPKTFGSPLIGCIKFRGLDQRNQGPPKARSEITGGRIRSTSGWDTAVIRGVRGLREGRERDLFRLAGTLYELLCRRLHSTKRGVVTFGTTPMCTGNTAAPPLGLKNLPKLPPRIYRE